MAQTALDLGYSPDQIAKIGNGSALTPSTTITASSLAPTPSVNFPPPPPVNTGLATNASIPSPIQDPASLVNQAYAPTQADKQQTDIMSRIAQATGSQTPLSTLQVQQQNAYGVPDAAKTLNSLQTQLQGLNDQATALQNEAAYTIPNQMQLSAQGRGVTEAGLAPLTASALRQNQIKQGAIATQALTVKAAYYAAQGNYAIAKEAADKAAQVAFDNSEQEIKGLKAQLDVLTPTLNKEEKGRAALLQVQLQDRQKQIDNQREDFKTGQAMAIAAMKFYADNPTVQFNAQQALKLDPSDPAYLQKVMGLVGSYQQDPLEMKYKQAQIDKLNAEAAKDNIPAITNPQAGKYAGALSTILGSSRFTAQQKASVINAVNNGDDPFTVIKNNAKSMLGQTEATTVTKYESAKGAMEDIQRALKEYYANGGQTGIFSGNLEKVINKLGDVNDPALVGIATQIQAQLQVYRNAISGTAYSDQEGKDIASIFPGINKSQGLNDAIIQGRLKAFDSTIDQTYKTVLGNTYDALKAEQPQKDPIASQAPAQYSQYASQLQPGEILVIRGGQVLAITRDEYNPKTDQLPAGAMNKI